MSSDEDEEIDNVFLNECVDDEINNKHNSDDSQIWMLKMILILVLPLLLRKKTTKNTKREGEAKQGGLIIHSTSSVY